MSQGEERVLNLTWWGISLTGGSWSSIRNYRKKGRKGRESRDGTFEQIWTKEEKEFSIFSEKVEGRKERGKYDFPMEKWEYSRDISFSCWPSFLTSPYRMTKESFSSLSSLYWFENAIRLLIESLQFSLSPTLSLRSHTSSVFLFPGYRTVNPIGTALVLFSFLSGLVPFNFHLSTPLTTSATFSSSFDLILIQLNFIFWIHFSHSFHLCKLIPSPNILLSSFVSYYYSPKVCQGYKEYTSKPKTFLIDTPGEGDFRSFLAWVGYRK